MSHQVREHTRRVNGKTVTVRRHTQADQPTNASGRTESEQRKRDTFERRVQRERQDMQRASDFGTPMKYPPGEVKPRKRKSKAVQRAKKHWKTATRQWRKHKVRAVAHGMLAAGNLAGAGAAKAYRGGRSAVRKYRKSRARKRGRR